MKLTPWFLATLLLASRIFSGLAIAQAPSTSAAMIVPLDGPVLAGKPVMFKLSGNPSNPHWKLGDGTTVDGASVSHTFEKPGIYRVVMGSKTGDTFNERSPAIVRVHTPETVHLPQAILDTEASKAILAAARGASPDNPVWVLPVGPCTNIASAILQAREEGLDLKDRIQIAWLGGGPEQVNVRSFNGSNDPWSVYVTGQSGLEFWIILENPTGASITMDKSVESDLYPENPLGKYLEAITPDKKKALYDLTAVSLVVGQHLGKPWLTSVEPSVVLGPDREYRWQKVDSPTNISIVRKIDAEAMKADFFNTLNGKPTSLPPQQQN